MVSRARRARGDGTSTGVGLGGEGMEQLRHRVVPQLLLLEKPVVDGRGPVPGVTAGMRMKAATEAGRALTSLMVWLNVSTTMVATAPV